MKIKRIGIYFIVEKVRRVFLREFVKLLINVGKIF